MIKLDKNKDIPEIQNSSDYIFHVFNEDFINKNIASEIDEFHNSIKGFIIGKENIDINELEIKLEKLKKEKDKIDDKIRDKIREKQNKLKEIFKGQKPIKHRIYVDENKIASNLISNEEEIKDLKKSLNDYIDQYEKIRETFKVLGFYKN